MHYRRTLSSAEPHIYHTHDYDIDSQNDALDRNPLSTCNTAMRVDPSESPREMSYARDLRRTALLRPTR